MKNNRNSTNQFITKKVNINEVELIINLRIF